MLHTIDRRVYWNDFEVYTDSEYSLYGNRHDCLYKDLTETIFNLLCYASSRHRNVQFIRFEITFEKEIYFFHHMIYFNLFLSDFVKTCSRLEAGKVTPYYFWCREKSKEDKNAHFHFFLLLCDKTQKEYKFLLKKAQKILDKKLLRANTEGYINFGAKDRHGNYQENGITIKQDGILNEREFRRCFQWATYLAKKRTKESRLPRVRRYNKSKLPLEAFDTNWLEWFYGQFPRRL